MEVLMDEVCGTIHNYFAIRDAVQTGSFTIAGGGIEADFLQNGQYFRVIGSVFNDGIWQFPAEGMTDETFKGSIVPLAIPQAFIAIVDEIQKWINDYGASVMSPMQSESFNNYSYSKAAGTAQDGSYAALSWENIFAKRLERWRKLP